MDQVGLVLGRGRLQRRRIADHSTSPGALLRAPRLEDAAALFPQIFRTSVIDGIAWDGPESEHDYVTRLRIIIDEVRAGQRYFFSIIDPETGAPMGSCDVRPDGVRFRATLGLWIGETHQSQGFGTLAVAELVRFSFDELGLHKLDAEIFVDNWSSRRVFEKNGFTLEGTIRGALLKRGVPLDEWHLGLLNPRSRFLAAVDR